MYLIGFVENLLTELCGSGQVIWLSIIHLIFLIFVGNLLNEVCGCLLYRSRVYFDRIVFPRCVFNKRIESFSSFHVLLILTTQIFYKVKMRQ